MSRLSEDERDQVQAIYAGPIPASGNFKADAKGETTATFTAYSTTVHILRDRHGATAMTNDKRRLSAGRRSSSDRRTGTDTRSEEERMLIEERRSTTDRRLGLDRRSSTTADRAPTNGRRIKD